MTSLKKKVIVRDRHRNHLQKLFDEFNALTLTTENVTEINLRKYQKTLLEKSELLKKLDDEILDLINEDETDHINSEVDSSSKQNEDINEVLVKIENLLSSQNRNENILSPHHSDISSIGSHNPVSTNVMHDNIKVPKLMIEKFDGNVLHFLRFWDQFKSAIHTNSKLNNIDKFNYLITYLKDEPLDTIRGLTLSSENYSQAIEILHERYGNKQILISSQMDVLVKLPRVTSMNDIYTLRKILNSLETSVRNLTDLDVEMNSYGTLLISIIFDRIPNELQIIISRKFKNDVWDLQTLIDIFKQELFARERCYAIGKDSDNDPPKDPFFTGHSLLTHSQEKGKQRKPFKPNARPENCVYCDDKKHISSRCNIITNVETRKNLLKNQGRCFICLAKGHVSKNCKANYSCVKCKNRHHVSICSAKDDKSKIHTDNNGTDGDTPPQTTLQISNPSSTTIILQTAKATVLNPDENHSTETRLLFDSCSQRTYCTDDLKKKLNLKKVRTELILLKRFASDEGVLKELDVVQICLKGKLKAINTYIEALSIPFICSPIQNQNIDFSEKNNETSFKFTTCRHI